MSLIANYDAEGYSYQEYWRGRAYEHRAELHAMELMLSSNQRGWIADLGGGFGRMAPAYLHQGRPVVWVDYSLKLLGQAQARYRPPTTGRMYVAANLNHLPFRSRSLSTTLLIRVLHHLSSYDRVLREVSRVANAEWVIDIPQKLHVLAQMRSLVRGQWRVGHEEVPINLSRQPNQVFLNYHPRSIERRLSSLGWVVRDRRSLSNLRLPWLKQWIGVERLLTVEKWLQPHMAPLRFGPNLWYALARFEPERVSQSDDREILACPACLGTLEGRGFHSVACPFCQQLFTCRDGVWDFRWPRPQTLE